MTMKLFELPEVTNMSSLERKLRDGRFVRRGGVRMATYVFTVKEVEELLRMMDKR